MSKPICSAWWDILTQGQVLNFQAFSKSHILNPSKSIMACFSPLPPFPEPVFSWWSNPIHQRGFVSPSEESLILFESTLQLAACRNWSRRLCAVFCLPAKIYPSIHPYCTSIVCTHLSYSRLQVSGSYGHKSGNNPGWGTTLTHLSLTHAHLWTI